MLRLTPSQPSWFGCGLSAFAAGPKFAPMDGSQLDSIGKQGMELLNRLKMPSVLKVVGVQIFSSVTATVLAAAAFSLYLSAVLPCASADEVTTAIFPGLCFGLLFGMYMAAIFRVRELDDYLSELRKVVRELEGTWILHVVPRHLCSSAVFYASWGRKDVYVEFVPSLVAVLTHAVRDSVHSQDFAAYAA